MSPECTTLAAMRPIECMDYDPRSAMSQENESTEPRSIEDYQAPLWAPPPPPAFGEREWFSLIFERYGFAIASFFTLSVILVLFLNADLLLKRPTGEAEAAEDVAVSVITQPASATVLIDGDSVGVAPLYGYGLAPGTYLLSLRAPGRGAVDTVITVPGAMTDFAFRLPYAGARPAGLGPERQDAPLARDDEAEPLPATESTGATEAAIAAGEGAGEATPEPPRRATPPASEAPRSAEPAPQRPEPQAALQEEARPEEAPQEETLPEEPAPLVGALEILSEPSGAAVMLNGEPAGRTPLTLADLPTGDHRATLRLDGYDDATMTLFVEPGKTTQARQILAPAQGTLRILAKPWGSIYIDGVLHEEEASVWYTVRLPVGEHRVRVTHPTLGKWEQVVRVPAGDPREVVIDFTFDQN